MPRNATSQAALSPQQVLAIEQLAIGATVICAAEAAGVNPLKSQTRPRLTPPECTNPL